MSGGSSRRGFLRELASAAREVRSAGDAGRDLYAEAETSLLAGGSGGEEVAAPARAAGELDPEERDRYARQLALSEWGEAAQLALRAASVLVVGAGALGSPVALYLAGAGVGRLGIADPDPVELAALHRQLLHFTPDVGVAKAHSAAAKLAFLNPEVEVVPYEVRLEPDNAAGLLVGHDLVVECTGSVEVRSAVNAACCAARTALVVGEVGGLSGLVMSVRPGEGACYRCAFPGAPTSEPGVVLGPAAGVIGSLQALEALKLLTAFAPPSDGAYVRVDLTGVETTRVALTRRPGCPDCGGL